MGVLEALVASPHAGLLAHPAGAQLHLGGARRRRGRKRSSGGGGAGLHFVFHTNALTM